MTAKPVTNEKLLKEMPKTVRIGCFNYAVEQMHTDDAEIASVYGATKFSTLKIRIRPNMPPQQLANTFLHECLHGIHDIYGLNDDSKEEEFANLSANGLCAFWQDNPHAMIWIQKALGEK